MSAAKEGRADMCDDREGALPSYAVSTVVDTRGTVTTVPRIQRRPPTLPLVFLHKVLSR